METEIKETDRMTLLWRKEYGKGYDKRKSMISSLGSVALQSFMNSFGSTTVAAISTVTSQNLGAGQKMCVKKGLYVGISSLAVRIGMSYLLKPFFRNMVIAYAEVISWWYMFAMYGGRLFWHRMKGRVEHGI